MIALHPFAIQFVLFPGLSVEISRLEDELAKAKSAESSARAGMIKSEERSQEECSRLKSLLEDSRAQASRLQSQLNTSAETGDRMLREQEVRPSTVVSLKLFISRQKFWIYHYGSPGKTMSPSEMFHFITINHFSFCLSNKSFKFGM